MQVNPSTLLSSITGNTASILSSSATSVFNELIDDSKMLDSQYELLQGKWPEKFDEVILILPDANGISDLLLYSLGLRDSDELEDMISKIMKDEEVKNENKPLEFSYDELMNIQLKLVDATDTYQYNKKYKIYESMTDEFHFILMILTQKNCLLIF